jgi:hypothetical protein
MMILYNVHASPRKRGRYGTGTFFLSNYKVYLVVPVSKQPGEWQIHINCYLSIWVGDRLDCNLLMHQYHTVVPVHMQSQLFNIREYLT